MNDAVGFHVLQRELVVITHRCIVLRVFILFFSTHCYNKSDYEELDSYSFPRRTWSSTENNVSRKKNQMSFANGNTLRSPYLSNVFTNRMHLSKGFSISYIHFVKIKFKKSEIEKSYWS